MKKLSYLKLFEEYSVPQVILDNIGVVYVKHIDFNGNTKNGKILCNKLLINDLELIFAELYELKFPIYQIRPIDEFGNDDMKSVINNNTSCFNYREVIGSNKLSDHATGNAIDINPMQNPWIHPSAHKIDGRKYDISQKGTISDDVVNIFIKHGWSWGGQWRNPDYQHFFKKTA